MSVLNLSQGPGVHFWVVREGVWWMQFQWQLAHPPPPPRLRLCAVGEMWTMLDPLGRPGW